MTTRVRDESIRVRTQRTDTGPDEGTGHISRAAALLSTLDREHAEALMAALPPETAEIIRSQLLSTKQVPDEEYAKIAADLRHPVSDKPHFSLSELQRQTIDQLARIRVRAEEFAADTKSEIERLRREAETALAAESARLCDKEAELDRKRNALDGQLTQLKEQQRLLDEANYEETRQKGYTEGKRQGFTQGYQEGVEQAQQEHKKQVEEEVDRRLNDQVSRSLPAVECLVEELTAARASLLGHWEENILQIAAALAYQTVLRELPKLPDLPLTLLREALELAVGNTTLKVRMNPGDLKELQGRVEQLLHATRGLTGAELVADAKVSPGGCLVETSHGTIDERLESRLERIITELARN
ncbi:MAG: FliH/SctL family protein [Planctomycetia bacterium]|nr:FliH/SctL family protein [Planctomycetia bacterium]